MTPAKYFLALDGVKGDSLDSNHEGWFEISDFDIDLDNVFAGAPGGPGGPGKPDFSPLTLTLNSNTGLAPLLTMAATGATLNGATLVGVTATGQQVYQLDLADVLVTKVEDDAGAGLTLSLDYGKIELETFTQNGTGGVVPEGQFGFDRTANTGGVTVASALPSGSVDPSPPAETYFMLIDGLNGGSTDPSHMGWFEITGVDLDLEKLFAGGTNFSPLIVTPENEAALADVMDLAATGGHVKGVHIEGFTGGTNPAEVYDLTLADVTVTEVADGEGDGYSLSLDYGKIALVTKSIDATGQQTTNGEFGYDVVNNVEIDPFTLNLNPNGHHAPVADAQSISTDEDTATAVTLSGSDVDGDSLTFTVLSGPAHGTLSGSGANLTYTPDPDYNGPDLFTYVANDGELDSAAASISLTVQAVNDAPAANARSISTDEDTATAVTLSGSDVDGDSLTFTMLSGPAHGTLSGSGANLTYTPDPNYNGPDSFTYVANDGEQDSAAASVSLTVNPVNDAPVADAQSISTDEDNATSVTLSGSDVDGDSLAFRVVNDPAHGTLSGTGANLTYTPAANYSGPDSFTYVANDGAADSAAASISLTVQAVNDAQFSAGILTEFGDNLDNTIETSRNAAGDILVNGGAVPVQGSTPTVANTHLIQVFGQGGNDTITLDQTNGALPRANLFGGAGNDTITGGSGADMLFGQGDNDILLGKGGFDFLFGGAGNDTLTGGVGDDTAFMGAGDNSFVWNPGDDDDIVEGQDGFDTLLFNGAVIGENIDIVANGGRVLFTRDIANVTMDLNDVESIDFRALFGADNIVVGDLSGTDVTEVNVDLGGGDLAADTVTVNATNGDDVILISGDASGITIFGLAAQVNIENFDANDRLVIKGLAGDDVIEAPMLAASGILLTADGGAGDDVLIGGGGLNVLDGGPGDNILIF